MAIRPTSQTDPVADGPTTTPSNDEPAGSAAVSVLLGIAVALVVAGGLSSGRLVDMAARLPFGDNRDRWLAAAESLDESASSVGLDQPADAVAAALDRERPGSGADAADPTKVVVGELATGAAQRTTATTTTMPASTTDGPSTTDPSTTAPLTTAPTTATPTTTVPTTTTAPPTTVRQLRTVTAENPLRIWMGGDSLGEYVATGFLGGIADRQLTSITYDYNISTGLARPDQFDWFERLSEQMVSETPPEAVIWMVGGNDNQDMLTEAGRVSYPSPEWEAEYRARVGTLMDITAYPDVQMIWIGLPPMQPQPWTELPIITNPILEQEAAVRPWVTYVDIWDLFLDEDGTYNPRIVGPDGTERLARAPDGVHITRRASEWVADLAWDEIARVWALPNQN